MEIQSHAQLVVWRSLEEEATGLIPISDHFLLIDYNFR